jgi:hypothetical protein
VPSYPGNVKGIQILDEVVAKAMTDTAFRRRLLDDPKAVLRKAGLEIPDEVEIVVHRNLPGLINLVLPEAPLPSERLKPGELDVRRCVMHHAF